MPDPSHSTPCAPASPLDAAQVLEDAADWLLVHGVCRDGTYGLSGTTRCTMGAIFEVSRSDRKQAGAEAGLALQGWLRSSYLPPVHRWNDNTTDDFEVIDTLRLVAKDLRATAAPS